MSPTRCKLAGFLLAAVPSAMYLWLATSGLIHGLGPQSLHYVVLIAPLLLLAVLAWPRPLVGGSTLTFVTVILAVLFLLDTAPVSPRRGAGNHGRALSVADPRRSSLPGGGS